MLRTTLIATFALTLAAAPAQAFVASSGPEGLDLREDGERAEVALSLVTSGGMSRYRVEVPRPAIGQNRMTVGAGCVKESDDVALCDRVTPKVTVGLGGADDVFTTDPAFPDPITINPGRGHDVLRLGAGNDTVVEATRDDVFGEGGDDTMTAVSGGAIGNSELHGGPGNDTLTGLNGYNQLFGEDGDDKLAVEQSEVAFTGGDLIGGPGTDTFRLNGRGNIDSRDGVAETVLCGNRRGENPFRGRDAAVIDLVDTLDPALPGGGCSSVDRAPRNEKTSIRLVSTSLKVGKVRRRVGVRIRCWIAKSCKGTLQLRVGNSTDRHTKTYRLGGGQATTIQVGLTPTAFRKIEGTKTIATVTLTEKGDKGARTVEQRLRIRGRS
jgi:hypothetical protein